MSACDSTGVLLRSWNLFHGNAVPPERRAFLPDMVRLAAEGEPDVVCLQEVPLWALPHLAGWSGMQAVGAVAAPARLGPLPGHPLLGRALTAIHHGAIRSAFTGQANAILLAPHLRLLGEERIVLNPRRFRDAQARSLGLGAVARLAWARERRVCHAVRLAAPGLGRLVVANLHATSFPADTRLAEAEVLRAGAFLDALPEPGEAAVLAGDFNVSAEAPVFAELGTWGLAGGGNVIDHILVRGVEASPVETWPEERRRRGGRLLSDHAPVEVRLG